MTGRTDLTYNFETMTIPTKNGHLNRLSTFKYIGPSDYPNQDLFYSRFNKTCTVLYHGSQKIMIFYMNKLKRRFPPKFYHENKDKTFVKHWKYVGEINKIDNPLLSECVDFGRKL